MKYKKYLKSDDLYPDKQNLTKLNRLIKKGFKFIDVYEDILTELRNIKKTDESWSSIKDMRKLIIKLTSTITSVDNRDYDKI